MPFTGPMKVESRCLRIATFATVAGCIHIFPFIAGASSCGASVASTMDVKASSASFWLRFCWRRLEAGPPIRQNGRAGHAGRIFLVLRNPATADCGILVLRRINLGEVFRFDKMPVLQAVRRDLFFDVRGRRWYLRRVSLSMGGGTRNRISRTL